MKKAEHHKKEMIKSNLIRNETLIADPEIREKVDELRDLRDKKKEEKANRHLNRRLNMGLNKDMEMKDETGAIKNDVTMKKEKPKLSNKKKQRVAMKQKAMNVNRNIKIEKRSNKIEVDAE